MSYTADVAIIGGGVIGASIAYQLVKAGKTVVVAEKYDHTAGATGSCDQMVIMQSKKPGINLKLAMDSAEMFKTLNQELDCDVEYVNEGGMITIENELEMEVMQQFTKEQRAIGLDVTILSKAEADRRQPGLGKHLLGCTYSPQDGHVNPFFLNFGFARAARKRGAEILIDAPVTDFYFDGETLTGFATPKGDVYAGTIVLAAGPWSPLLGEKLGIHIPIKPRRGQIAISEPVAPFVRYPTLSAQYIVAKHHPETLANAKSLAVQLGVGLSLTQGSRGEILIGATREFVGYDKSNTREGVRELLKNAARLIPGLADLNIVRIMGGLRPYTVDGMPLVGFVDAVPGLFLCCGHEGDGIALSSITGVIAKELIVDGKAYTDVSELDPNRFDLKAAV